MFISFSRKELLVALGYTDRFRIKHLIETEASYQEIFKEYQEHDTKVLTVANGLWVRNNVINQNFTKLLTESYKADVSELGKGDKAADTINNWVMKSTNGKIDKIVGK